MDVEHREVEGEWHQTQNQHKTSEHLKVVSQRYQERGGRYLVFWTSVPWHIAHSVRGEMAQHNRKAKGTGDFG